MIAVFTKYDQFKRNIEIQLEDQGRDPALFNDEIERIFGEQYLANLRRSPPFVRLEGEDIVNQLTCTMLISIVQECMRKANNVRNLSKRLPMRSIVVQFHSYSSRYKRIIWG